MTIAVSTRMPYPGLRSFRREESDLFFGREDCITTMVDRLAATHFLAVLGSSGTGKSSVVKTGLLDALDLGVMASAGSSWRVVDFRPRSTPFANLARGLLETNPTPPGGHVSETDVDLLRAFLVRGPRSVVEWCRDGHLPPHTNLLLLVDQFEELFRYQDYAGREEAEAFAALLMESARSTQVPIYVTLTMRSEYLGACALIEGLAEAISTGIFLTPRMTREQCRTAIVGPAAVCGVEIESALVNRLLNDLAAFAPWDDRGNRDRLDRLIRRADQLPLLQYCLNRMCVRAQHDAPADALTLTLADYRRIGGLGGALNAHADDILRAFGGGMLPAVESVFRALTEGSSISEAVRRPTRLRELVDICGTDETAVRAVVDAFRVPGCNFLSPEFDPKNPKPLDAATIIDISHESLIRQWKKLSEWLENEARAGRQWRRLLDRFEVGEPMHGAELANILAWRNSEKPNAAWARRYGGDFPAIMAFIEDSERQRRRFAPLVLPVVGSAVSSTSQVLAAGIWSSVYAASPPSWAWVVQLAVYAGSPAITMAFGLWLYANVTLKRAVLAAATIFALEFISGAAVIGSMFSKNATPLLGIHVWAVTFYAPATLTVMAIFAPAFRSLAVWMLLVLLVDVLLGPPLWLFDTGMISADAVNALVSAAGFVYTAAIGLQLRRGSESVEISEQKRRKFAPVAVALFGLLVLGYSFILEIVITVSIRCAYGACSGSIDQPRMWLFNIGLAAETTAITIAFGLWRYSGLAVRSAARVGSTIFALDIAAGSALVGVLLSRGTTEVHALHWWYATLYPPCTLAAIAIFEPTYRRASVWMPFLALFSIPYGLMVWLYDSSYILPPQLVIALLGCAIQILWFAAIAYQLRSPDVPAFATALRRLSGREYASG